MPARSELDYRAVFEAAPTSLWIEDYSAVVEEFARLRSAGIAAVGDHLRGDPDAARRCLNLVQIRSVNAETLTIFGADDADQLIARLDDVFGPEALPTFAERLAVLADGGTQFASEVTVRRLDGAPIQVLAQLVVPGDPPDFSHVITSVSDITWRQRLESKQRQQNNFLDAMIENIPDMIFVKEAPAMRFVRLNRAGEELLGVSRQRIYGQADGDLFPAAQAARNAVTDREVFAAGRPIEIAEEAIDTPSARRWLRTRKVPLYDDSGEAAFLLGISTDITELRQVRANLERSNRDLEQFAFAASHDLREPLRTVKSFVDLLVSDLDAAEASGLEAADVGQYVTFITAACERMQRRIDALLRLSRIGRKQHERVALNLSELVDEVCETLRTAIDESGAAITRDELPAVVADGPLLGDVVQNLLANALKFTSGAPPEVHVSASRGDREWLIAVRDNGIGFPQAQADHIFGVFKRLHSVNAYPGTGIGLALCKRIVEDHGGRIWAESQPGAATTFTFSVPDDAPTA